MSPVHAGSQRVFAGLSRRPVTLLVLFSALLVVGVIAYARIPMQLFPSGLVEPELWVQVFHPGASAPENEEKVARPLEEQLRTLAGVTNIYSRSREDSVGIGVRFKADTSMDLARAEVRDRVERARAKLPETVQEIGIYSFSMDDIPIMFMAVLHPGDSDRTDFLVDNVIARTLEGVDGVGKIEVDGALDDSVRILLDEDRVQAANLDLGQLISRLSNDNFALPLGEVTDGGARILLRSDMRFTTPEEIEAYPIGGGLRIGDVGQVIKAKSVRNRMFRINGSYSYFVAVFKNSQANAVETCRNVMATIAELEDDPRLGEFGFLVFWNEGETIEDSLGQLQTTAVWGGGLAVLVLFVFLRRVRTTLCVALSIPFSVILALAVQYFAGGTFNLFTMMGVTLALGMLVDNSVVVIENISRVRGTGRDRREAAVAGTREVALAVTLATMTTIVVFLPLIFMASNPILQLIFAEIGTPLCVALAFSLLAALVFLPVIAGRVVGPRPGPVERLARALAPVARLPVRAIALLVGALRVVAHGAVVLAFHVERAVLWLFITPVRWLLALGIGGLLALRVTTALAAQPLKERLGAFGLGAGPPAATLIAIASVLAAFAIGIALLGISRWRARPQRPPARPASFAPAGDSAVDMMIRSNRALVSWSIDHRVLATGFAGLAFLSILVPINLMVVAAFGEDENSSRFEIEVDLEQNFTLAEADEEFRHYEEFFESKKEVYGFEDMGVWFSERGGDVDLYWDVRNPREHLEWVRADVMANLTIPPGHTVRFFEGADESSRNKNLVTWQLTGPDSEELDRYGLQALELLSTLPGLNSVKSPLENAPGQVRVVMDAERANSLGVTADAALQNIAWALSGWQLPRFHEEGRELPLIIEYDDEELAGLSTLEDLQIFTGESVVPLASFADLRFEKGSRTIRRRNGQVSFTIQGRVDSPIQQKPVSDAGYELLKRELRLPRGYSIGEEGLVSTRQDEEMKELMGALALSVVLVFLLMGILFESFLLPFSVLFTIPFAIMGAYWTLFLSGTTMDSVGWIGMIVLVGVVVNNGIVLMDRIHGLRLSEGLERRRAVIEGVGSRVRPIVMTALTTVIGLLPMAISQPSGNGFDYRALATCVAGGLAISTFFTLWVVPLAYTVFDDLATALSTRFTWAVRPMRRGGRESGAESSQA